MAILVDKDSRILVQGMTGTAGQFHTKRMLEYGTKIVSGTSPGKGGEMVESIPVFDTVESAIDNTGVDTSVIFLPAAFVKEAAIESIWAGIKHVVVVPEHIPIFDMMEIRKEAKRYGSTVLGGNTPGIITPGQANIGIMPDIAFKPGKIGTVSRSGSITYYVADTLTRSGYGETTCVGLGGDPVLGSTFDDILRMFEKDDETEAVVMCGEIGGVYEEIAKDTIKRMKKPVICIIGGIYAPPGKRMGHAGAIVEGSMGTAKSKLKALEDAGAHAARTFLDIPKILEDLNIEPVEKPK